MNEIIRSWTEEQIAPWEKLDRPRSEVYAALLRLNDATRSIYIFEINNGEVNLLPKNAKDEAGRLLEHEGLYQRALLYKYLLELTVKESRFDRPLRLGIDMEDGAPPRRNPIFSFQKLKKTNVILLPDMELIENEFYENKFTDNTVFSEKICGALFSGSTTGGGLLTLESAKDLKSPRLRAANYFRGKSDVKFHLPQIVQCATPDVEVYLREQGYGVGRTDWSYAFKHKFLISIDGNGAPCSRPLISLRSQSALIKYNSDYVLYYTSSLIPWLHYIPVNHDEEVTDFISNERDCPGRYEYIAEAGRKFSHHCLGREYALAYTTSILKAYDNIFRHI